MERRPTVTSRLNILIATIAALLAAASSAYAEPPAGTKNFSAPGMAPNYFSNESGPVMRQPAPLPVAPPAPVRASREAEEPEGQAEAAAPKPERHVVQSVKGRDRHRAGHAQVRSADRRKATAAHARNSKSPRVVTRSEKPRAARVAHAEPHGVKARPVSAKGHRAGRG